MEKTNQAMQTNKQSNKEVLDALLQQFKNGNQDAFEEIYQRCHKHVAFVCSKLTNNAQDIEEIVQDTFMAIYKKAHDLDADTFMGLLRKIAAYRCYDKHRQKKDWLPLDTTLQNSMEANHTMDEAFLPEAYLQEKEKQVEILTLINSLPAKQREMIYLYYYADMNTEEIAALHNCSSSNVRKLLFNARANIKSHLATRITTGKTTGKASKISAVVGIGALLLVEEQVFAATYVIAATAATAAASGAGGYATSQLVADVAIKATNTTRYVLTALGAVGAASAVAVAVYVTAFTGGNPVPVETPLAIVSPYAAYTPAVDLTPPPTRDEDAVLDEIEETPPTEYMVDDTPEYITSNYVTYTDTYTNMYIGANQEPDEEIEPEAPHTPEVPEGEVFQPLLASPPEEATGEILEEVSTMDYGAVLQDRIFDEVEYEVYKTDIIEDAADALPPLSQDAPPITLPPVYLHYPTYPELETAADTSSDVEEPTDLPETVPFDRTETILAALQAVNTLEGARLIVAYYGFYPLDTVVRSSKRVSFYVTDEGSGNIVVGISRCYDTGEWNMNFEHFGHRPLPDTVDLFHWM